MRRADRLALLKVNLNRFVLLVSHLCLFCSSVSDTWLLNAHSRPALTPSVTKQTNMKAACNGSTSLGTN